MPLVQPPATLPAHTLNAMLRRYDAKQVGVPVSCERLPEGLLNRGYRLTTGHGRYFLKHHLEDAVTTIVRQHAATARLANLGLPVAPPLRDRTGCTVVEVDGSRYALHPWVEGRHRDGSELDVEQSERLGELLGRVHLGLAQAIAATTRQPAAHTALPNPRGPKPETPAKAAAPTGHRAPAHATPHATRTTPRSASAPRSASTVSASASTTAPTPPPVDATNPSAQVNDTYALIEDLLARVLATSRPDGFDLLAAHRLRERRELLRRYAHCRPGDEVAPISGWVHGDFHPLNILYASASPHAPVAIVDWDRLAVRPRAEEAVRAAVIFFLRPDGTLELSKIQAYARAYRATVGATSAELAAGVHRVWWERLNDFWMLRWRYQLGDSRTDRQFPAAAALVGWWTAEYQRVRTTFCQ